MQQKVLPMEEWRIRINDKYPAYISWGTYEQIRAMLKDNHAEYDRNKSRGIPRPGKALLHGITYCGECGHKLVVQYKTSTRYLCNSLRQQYRVPVCQFIPADPVDDCVVELFFTALSPVELDAYSRAVKVAEQSAQGVDQAQRQQLERLRYQATLAERQFNKSDPDNRLVTGELERRWEVALQELKQAEATYKKGQQRDTSAAPMLSPKLKNAFSAVGKKLPDLWSGETLSRTQKKALLRCLIDKVVIHRSRRDRVRTRIVWKGGDTTTVEVPIAVNSLAELSNGAEFERQILKRHRQGDDDQTIARQLTAKGFRSPLTPTEVLPSTVQAIRLKHGLMANRHQSHPRRIPGYLTVPQLAQALGLSVYWFYDRINKGTIVISRDEKYGLYLFPDKPKTLREFEKLKAGKCERLEVPPAVS